MSEQWPSPLSQRDSDWASSKIEYLTRLMRQLDSRKASIESAALPLLGRSKAREYQRCLLAELEASKLELERSVLELQSLLYESDSIVAERYLSDSQGA